VNASPGLLERVLTAETPSSQRSEYLFIKSSLLLAPGCLRGEPNKKRYEISSPLTHPYTHSHIDRMDADDICLYRGSEVHPMKATIKKKSHNLDEKMIGEARRLFNVKTIRRLFKGIAESDRGPRDRRVSRQAAQRRSLPDHLQMKYFLDTNVY
jgi:hypothetical protein